MKVRVAFSIEVDTATWKEVYGSPHDDQRAIRQAVRRYAELQLAESGAAEEEAILGVKAT